MQYILVNTVTSHIDKATLKLSILPQPGQCGIESLDGFDGNGPKMTDFPWFEC